MCVFSVFLAYAHLLQTTITQKDHPKHISPPNSFIVFKVNHWVQFAVFIWAWLWRHPLGHRQPITGHYPKIKCLFPNSHERPTVPYVGMRSLLFMLEFSISYHMIYIDYLIVWLMTCEYLLFVWYEVHSIWFRVRRKSLTWKFPPSIMWDPKIKYRLTDIVANSFNRWVFTQHTQLFELLHNARKELTTRKQAPNPIKRVFARFLSVNYVSGY